MVQRSVWRVNVKEVRQLDGYGSFYLKESLECGLVG